MLNQWQNEFPTIFAAYPVLIEQNADSLTELLTKVEEHEFLNEKTINCLLENFTFFSHFLYQGIAMDGFVFARTLFELGEIPYQEAHLNAFCVLTSVLATPLCITIFNARLRGFSDYSDVAEPVNPALVSELIQNLCALDDEEIRIRCFFNTFVKLRPHPMSQKYQIELDVGYEVQAALINYCESKINMIESPQDYQQTRLMIQNLQTGCHDKVIFNCIKYEVANKIVSEDFHSTQRYDELMAEIEPVLNKPLINLNDFTVNLERSKGYLKMASEAIRSFSSVISSNAADGENVGHKAGEDYIMR